MATSYTSTMELLCQIFVRIGGVEFYSIIISVAITIILTRLPVPTKHCRTNARLGTAPITLARSWRIAAMAHRRWPIARLPSAIYD